MLRLGNRAFGQEVGLRMARRRVIRDRLVQRRGNRMAGRADHGVIRPDHQLLLGLRLQGVYVVQRPARIEYRAPALVLDILRRDDGVRLRMASGAVDPPGRVENLGGDVAVERSGNRRDVLGVAHDPFDRAARIVYRAGHAERAVGVDEIHLGIDQQQDRAQFIGAGGWQIGGLPLADGGLDAGHIQRADTFGMVEIGKRRHRTPFAPYYTGLGGSWAACLLACVLCDRVLTKT